MKIILHIFPPLSNHSKRINFLSIKLFNEPVFTRRLNSDRARKRVLLATHAYLPWSSGCKSRMVKLCSVVSSLSLGNFPVQIGSQVIMGLGSPVAVQLTVTYKDRIGRHQSNKKVNTKQAKDRIQGTLDH